MAREVEKREGLGRGEAAATPETLARHEIHDTHKPVRMQDDEPEFDKDTDAGIVLPGHGEDDNDVAAPDATAAAADPSAPNVQSAADREAQRSKLETFLILASVCLAV